jgi:hypothetical protein
MLIVGYSFSLDYPDPSTNLFFFLCIHTLLSKGSFASNKCRTLPQQLILSWFMMFEVDIYDMLLGSVLLVEINAVLVFNHLVIF